MQSREFWDSKIAAAADKLGLNQGYKMLCVPWSTLGRADTVFLSANPGRAPENLDRLCTMSDERGNSYEVERHSTVSPITGQFLELISRLGLRPSEVLTGVLVPFRTNRWADLSPAMRREAVAIGMDFWTQALAVKRPKLIIACGEQPASAAVEILDAKLEASILSGWGKTSLRRFRAHDGAAVVQLPHLSTFKLLSREECREPLRRVFDLSAMLGYQ